MSDVYYHPEKLGLTQIDMLEEADLSYEFNMLVVWKDERGNRYYAQDSGCSCPSPFENYTSIEKLTPITLRTQDAFVRDVMNFPAESHEKTQMLSRVFPLEQDVL